MLFCEPIRALLSRTTEEEETSQIGENGRMVILLMNGIGIYNPFSLLNTFERLQL